VVIELLYRNVPVAIARDPLEHQGTWFAQQFSLVQTFDTHPDAARLSEFIDFSVRWHEAEGEPADWDQFQDVIESGGWEWRKLEGPIRAIVRAPVFMPGGEVSFRED
jgi:hypothetical protein